MMSDFEKSINASDLIDWIMCAFPDWCVGDVRAIVDHVNEMPSAQPEPCADTVSRTAAIEAQERIMSDHPLDGYEDGRLLINALKALPSVQTDLISTIQNGINATNANDSYSCGMRNGMRWCISLIDDKEPLYENCPSEQPEPTLEQIEEYCHKRCLSIVDTALLHKYAQPESTRTFVELVVRYPDPELCTYKEYKGKPYYSIKYIENGETYVGYGTYNPEVLSQYLKEYFISSEQPEIIRYEDKYGYIGIETLLNFCENSKDHSVTPNDFMRMKRVRMPERKKGRKINQHSYPAKWLCSECGAKHFDFSDKFCSECGVNVEEGE